MLPQPMPLLAVLFRVDCRLRSLLMFYICTEEKILTALTARARASFSHRILFAFYMVF